MAADPVFAHTSFAAELLRMLGALTGCLGGASGWPPAIDPMAGDRTEAQRLLGTIAAELAAAPDVPSPARPAACAYGPLQELADRFGLHPAERDAVLLALVVEIDVRFARVMTLLNDHAERSRPTLGLACTVAAVSSGARVTALELADGPLVRNGLIAVEGDGPLPDLAMRVPLDVLRRLVPVARPSLASAEPPGVSTRRPPAVEVTIEDRARARLLAWHDALARADAPPLIVTGLRGAGRRTAAHAFGLGADRPFVSVDLDAHSPPELLVAGRREAIWRGAALAVQVAHAPDEAWWRALWATLDGVTPLIVAIAREALSTAVCAASRSPFVVELAEPSPALRARTWRAMLPAGHTLDDRAVDELSRRFRITPARVAAVIRHASAERALDGGAPLGASEIVAACRTTAERGIGSLARKLPLPHRREDLVVAPRVALELELATTWLRQRGKILDEWQLGARVTTSQGFVGLFAGPPGTGKTMAAQVMARELDLDLYRVDLSCVVSKYIGETEKHLARLFDEARAAGAGLLFDEADALFGKRSEARDAHDRYANIEIGYLLQRIEEHDGFVVLTTNRMRDLDEAFVRRFHAILDFQPPNEHERIRLWRGMVPASLPREALDLTQLSRFQLTGGEIRNVVVAAACVAAGEDAPLSMAHLSAALRREFAKNGRVLDERLFAGTGRA